MHSLLVILAILIATALIADRLIWLMIRWAPALGLMDQPGERRIHLAAVPRVGGVAVFLAVVAGIGLVWATGAAEDYGSYLLEGDTLLWLLGGALLLVVVGVVDDRYDLSAWVKIGGEVLAASLVFFGTREGFGTFMGVSVPWWLDYGLFVAWVVVLVNAFNLIDGMDGLCGGLGFISIGILGLLSIVGPTKGDALLLGVMGVSLLAFLRHNFQPGKVFLGDAGSMLIGYFIATAGTFTVGRRAVVAGLLLPLLVAGVPLFDVLLAVWRRGARKFAHGGEADAAPRIFGADKDHLHHRLLTKGFSQRQVALVMYGIALLLSLLALLPVLAGARYLTFSILGLVVSGLLGLRYIARIELVASQEGFRASLHKPFRRGWVVAGLLFIYDALVLAGSAWLALWLMERVMLHEWPFSRWIIVVSTFVTCGLLGLRFGEANQRFWARAGVADAVCALGWFACGVALSGVLITWFLQDLRFWLVLSHLAAAALAVCGLMVPRVLAVVLRESAVVAHHRRGDRSRPDSKRALLFGAGNMGELFVFWLGISRTSEWSNLVVTGFIDDQTGLRGRMIRGFPVHGSLDDLPVLVERLAVDCVVLTMSAAEESARARLVDSAAALGVEVLEWRPEMGMVACVEGKEVAPVAMLTEGKMEA